MGVKNKRLAKKPIAVATALALALGIAAINYSGFDDPAFAKYRGNFDSDLSYIKEAVEPVNSTYVSMTDAYGLNSVDSGKIITIADSEELDKFSSKCSTNTAFLGYTYNLIANIDYDPTSVFVPVGLSTPFSGTFEGNGYDINNLNMELKTGESGTITYYAMFAKNTGVIQNLGLNTPELTVTKPEVISNNGGVSYLVGLNSNEVNNCYVIDDGEALPTLAKSGDKLSGITAEECRISTLCVNNDSTGKLSNCYVAIGTVYNVQLQSVVEYAEITLQNSGSITNCHYLNNSILYVSGNTTVYKSGYNLTPKSVLPYGTYSSDQVELLTHYTGAGWYQKTSYGDSADFTGIKYAIRRGLSYNNGVFEINNEKDFAYMYELFNNDDHFADASLTYNINSDLNLALLPASSYAYSKGIASTIQGTSQDRNSTTLIDGSKSPYPTIFNADILNSSRIARNAGVDCYGLFNFITGTVKNLNVYAKQMNFSNIKESENVKSVGVLSGYVEKGTVDNVNVYATGITKTADIGEYYVGGITGILGGAGNIFNSTSAGLINVAEAGSTSIGNSSYMAGIAIGGIVGYIEESLGTVYNCVSDINITATLGSSVTYAIGGVIGAGYTTNYYYKDSNDFNQYYQTSNLENSGNITVGKTDGSTYSNLYVAGVIGRHLGATAQVNGFNNVGNITVHANANPTFVAGVENADIQTKDTSNTGLKASKFISKNGDFLFYATAFTNGAEIKVDTNSTALSYTNVLNITNQEVVSTLEGIINLGYNTDYNDNGSKVKTKIAGAQKIDANLINSFAGVLNINGTSPITNASMIYNLRDITFEFSNDVSQAKTFRYAGVVLGEKVNYSDIRNEGNLYVNLNKEISAQSTLIVSGLFDTLSNGYVADKLYNGGDITVFEPNGSNSAKAVNMYISGICYQNLSEDSSNAQNPLNANFDEELNGTLSNAINAGNISVDSYYKNKTTSINTIHSTHVNYVGNVYVGGITYLNKGIISSTFNLGNVEVNVYSTDIKNYEAGGIAYQMDGQYAQIRDAANNGDIHIIDLGGMSQNKKSIVNVGGIVARNTKNSTNNSQIVAFTINYGTLLAYQPYGNMSDTDISYGKVHSSAGGILGIGICNLVDIVNYGNVYGNECVAGIVCLVNLSVFDDSNVINLSNTINYAEIKINPQYYATDTSNTVYQTYNTIVSFEYVENSESHYKKTYAGAVSCIFDFAHKNNINVRFLINLYSEATTVLNNLNTPQNAPAVDTFITSHGLVDTFGGNSTPIKYAPLSTAEDEYGNIGAFSSRFIFRKAINMDNSVYKPETYLTDKYIPEFFQFVAFDKINPSLLESIGWRSIAYQTAAEELVKNVNALKALIVESHKMDTTNTISDALNEAFDSDTWLSTLDSDLFSSLLNASLDSNEFSNQLTSILEYVLFDTSATSTYTKNLRTSIVEEILDYYERQGVDDYYVILQGILYDELLAKVVSKDDTNYAAVKEKIEYVLKNADLSSVIETYIDVLENNSDILTQLFDEETGHYYEDSKIELIKTLLNGYDECTLEAIYNTINPADSSSVNAIMFKLYLQEHASTAKELYTHLILYNSMSENSNYLAWANKIIKKYDMDSVLEDEKAIDSNYTNAQDTFGDISSLVGYKYTPLNGIKNDKTQIIYSTEAQLKTKQNFVGQNVTSLGITPVKDYTELWNIIKNNSEVQNYISDLSNDFFKSFTNPTTGVTSTGIVALATEMNNTYQTNDRSQLSYGIPMDFKYGVSINNDYYGNSGWGSTAAIKSRFIYTPDEVVSYRTNYYGPYVSSNGDTYTADGNLIANNLNYNLGFVLNNVDGTQTDSTNRAMVPVFIGLNPQIVSEKISSSPIGNKKLYPFYWNDSNSGNGSMSSNLMWKDPTFVSQIPGNATGFIYSLRDISGNVINDITGDNYIVDGYNFNPTYVPTIDGDRAEKTYVSNDGVNYESKASKVNDTGASHTYRSCYLTGYASSAMITGIWYTYSAYLENSSYHISLHSKQEGTGAFTDYFGVHTTSYIGYTLKDLLALDGIRTKGKSNGIIDEDEINIVSAICTKLLEDNKELVLRALASYSAENSFTSKNASALNLLLSSVKDTEFAAETVQQTITSLLSFNYDNNLTFEQYLMSLNIKISNYRDKIISASAGNQDIFARFIILMLSNYSEKVSLYEDYNVYTRSDMLSLLYRYISYKYEQDNNISWNDFDLDISSISDADLQNISELLDFSARSKDISTLVVNDEILTTKIVINDSILYSNRYEYYDDNFSSNYDAVLVGKTNYDGNNSGSNVTLTTGNYAAGYEITVAYKGTIYLNSISNVNTSADLTTAVYTNVAALTENKLFYNAGTEIYEIVVKNNSTYAGQTLTGVTAVSPFAQMTATRTILNQNFGYHEDDNSVARNGKHYEIVWKQNEPTISQMDIKIRKGLNIDYNSVQLSIRVMSQYIDTTDFQPIIRLLYNGASYNYNSLYLGREKIQGKNYYLHKYSIDLSPSIVNQLKNNDIDLTIEVEKPGFTEERKDTTLILTDFLFTYDFDFFTGDRADNKTNAIFEQNLFNPYYSDTVCSNVILSNETSECSVTVNSGSYSYGSFTFPNEPDEGEYLAPTDASQLSAALNFIPTFNASQTSKGEIVNETIEFDKLNLTCSLVENLERINLDDISNIGMFLIKDYFEKQSSTSFDVNGPSYVEFYATGNGTISIVYEDTVIDTINVSTEEGQYKWYEYSTESGYNYSASSGVTIDNVYVAPQSIDIRYTPGNPDILVINDDYLVKFDYSEISNININNQYLEQFNETFGTSYEKYQLFYTVYPYYRNVVGKSNDELNKKDIFDVVITLMSTIKFDENHPNYYTLFSLEEFGDDELIEIIKLLSIADYNGNTSAFGKLFNGMNNNYRLQFIKTLCEDGTIEGIQYVRQNVVKAVYEYAKTHKSSELALFIYAAYLGDNYLDNSSLLTRTIMYDILDDFKSGIYQFIINDSTVDAEKVTKLISYLSNNSDINIDGYGIFALSSSHGIGYGVFIPDNLDLSSLDVKYTYNDSLECYVLINMAEYDLDNPTDVENLKEAMASWRGGYVAAAATDTESVDYAFYNDMKQLKLSISTDVFVLNFNSNTINSADDQIDSASGVITYYVDFTTFSEIYSANSLTISKSELANNAIISNDGTTSETTISLTGTNVKKTLNVSVIVENAFKVYAEDRTVSKSYTIKFIVAAPTNTTLTLVPTTLPYTGGKITGSVTGSNFPDGLDLEPLISIRIGNNGYTTEEGYWMLDPSVRGNAVVNNNTATVVLLIDQSLPGDDSVEVVINLFGKELTGTFKKEKNTEKLIKEIGFDGDLLTIKSRMTSSILFGRAYDYTDLTQQYIKTTDTIVTAKKQYYVASGDQTGYAFFPVKNPIEENLSSYYELNPNFYLYSLKYSANARINITASKSVNNTTGIMTYTITFTITSEAGGQPTTYNHVLTEQNYFPEGMIYAYLYADGLVVQPKPEDYDDIAEEDRHKYLSDGTFNYNFNSDEFTGESGTSLNDSMFMKVSFNRAEGREPQFRVKYVLTNFYTLGENVVFGPTAATKNNGAFTSNTYAGLTVTVSENNATGIYKFVYTYTNTGEWNDGDYTRSYEFPELIIEKMASTDALLKQITFLEEAISVGNTSTVIRRDKVLVPATPLPESDTIDYESAFAENDKEIRVSSKIHYSESAKAPEVKDYFVIGTVSNADLSYYAPTFGIDKYAQMYKYTTALKLSSYGGDTQTLKDKVILSDHTSTMYLYVPFIDSNGTETVKFVELNGNYWTNVYEITEDGGLGNKIGTFPTESVTAKNAKSAPAIAGYQVASYAGEENENASLYMDYIGTPKDNHFWYISYVIFSEDKLDGADTPGNVRYYHISIIDLTNNIQFIAHIFTATSLNTADLYFTIADNIYDNTGVKTASRQLSAYAENAETTYSGPWTLISGFNQYDLIYDLQAMPRGYFYFYIDLPHGYVAKAYTDLENTLPENEAVEVGSYLPRSSILTLKINLYIVIVEGTGEDKENWAITTSDTNSVKATYVGKAPSSI